MDETVRKRSQFSYHQIPFDSQSLRWPVVVQLHVLKTSKGVQQVPHCEDAVGICIYQANLSLRFYHIAFHSF